MEDRIPDELLATADDGQRVPHRGSPLGPACQWFALCANEATTTEPHPVLGAVPICARCAAKVAALG